MNETTTTHKDAQGTFSQNTLLKGNRRYASGVLQNEFRVQEVTAQLSGWVPVIKLPLAVEGTIIKNVKALDSLNTNGDKEDTGSQVGAVLGKAGAKNKWEAAYFRKISETDSTVADVSDSDFGEGGTNRKGHILWVSYSPQAWMLIQAKYFKTEKESEPLDYTANQRYDINRMQLDLSVKF